MLVPKMVGTIFSQDTYFSVSLTRPDPYTGGECLVTCYVWSCTSVSYRTAPIGLQLFCIAMVMRGHTLSLNIHTLIEMIGKRTLRNMNCNVAFQQNNFAYCKSPDPRCTGLATLDYFSMLSSVI